MAVGGMAAIHAGHAPDGRPVAIKRLLDDRHETRFEIEARLLQRLDHPPGRAIPGLGARRAGSVPRHGVVDGEDLAARLRREGDPGVPTEDVLDWGRQATQALRYLH